MTAGPRGDPDEVTFPSQDPQSHDADPQDPTAATGLEPGGGVPPGETPPQAGQMSGAAGDARKHTPNMGPVAGNRTPMFIALGVLAVFVVMIAVLVGASFIPS